MKCFQFKTNQTEQATLSTSMLHALTQCCLSADLQPSVVCSQCVRQSRSTCRSKQACAAPQQVKSRHSKPRHLISFPPTHAITRQHVGVCVCVCVFFFLAALTSTRPPFSKRRAPATLKPLQLASGSLSRRSNNWQYTTTCLTLAQSRSRGSCRVGCRAATSAPSQHTHTARRHEHVRRPSPVPATAC